MLDEHEDRTGVNVAARAVRCVKAVTKHRDGPDTKTIFGGGRAIHQKIPKARQLAHGAVDGLGRRPAVDHHHRQGVVPIVLEGRDKNVAGNGRRQSYEHYVIPRMRNTYMLAGPATPEEVIWPR